MWKNITKVIVYLSPLDERRSLILKSSLSNLIDIPEEYFIVQVPKRKIADAIRDCISEKNMNYKEAFELIDLNYSQFSRVTSGANYTIDTLLKTLHGLGLEIQIVKKEN
ncbi:hypothetical protein [Pseudoneobacillus sp. C159]